MIQGINKEQIIIASTTWESNPLLAQQFDIIQAATPKQVFEQVECHPEIAAVVLDQELTHLEWQTVTRRLKNHFATFHIVIIILAPSITPLHIMTAIDAGADDCFKNPTDADELTARITLNIRRSHRDQNSNPLTRLPGNTAITRTMHERLEQPLALLYIDLDNFKAYNDHYGFQRGDMVLTATSRLIATIVNQNGTSSDFVGHLGGDDFVVITTPDRAETIAQHICVSFDALAPTFYEEHDRAYGGIVIRNRRGVLQKTPLITLSIATVWNKHRPLTNIPFIATIAAELKWYAKAVGTQQAGSRYVKDRRCS
ncbi:MAG: diguanylate cyclase [Candidatus Babeliales bacterium]